MSNSSFTAENLKQCIVEFGPAELKRFNHVYNVYERVEEVYDVYESGGDWWVEAAAQAGGQSHA